MKTGVFLCQVGAKDAVRMAAVADYARNLAEVEWVEEIPARTRLDPHTIAADLLRKDIDRVVLGGRSPGHLKPAFTRAMALAGKSADEVRLASFREHGAIAEIATERAKAILACAVQAVPFDLVAQPPTTPVNPATLIIGGGVAGIQAALEIADAGKKVYLIDRTATIGGHMAMFDKTFPTLDCAACILTPRMVSVGQHPMIELMTCSEVEEVRGGPGAYRIRIRKKATRVDRASCVACNVCAESCPVQVKSEFDKGLSNRRAIYIPFPQAVPNAYVVDGDNCTWVQSGGKKCGACAKKCPKECIHLDQDDEFMDIEAGQVVLATGYDVYDAARVDRYRYGQLPNVLTALEFERLTNASGPTGGKIVTKVKRYNKRLKADEWVFDPDSPSPRSVAIIHCVGSRDANHNRYCSRVCCMYSLKFAHLVREKLPDADCYEFYIDMRAFGKGYEEFAERIKDEGVFVIRGRSGNVSEKEGQMIVTGEDIVLDQVVEFPIDMVVLAVGLVAAAGTEELARMFGVNCDEDGWLSELNYNSDPTDTERGGIFVAGVCQAPKDIPDTVAQASAVAAGVLKNIHAGRTGGHRSMIQLSDIEARARHYAGSPAR
jgi:heterodisulfide reductase subunit A2